QVGDAEVLADLHVEWRQTLSRRAEASGQGRPGNQDIRGEADGEGEIVSPGLPLAGKGRDPSSRSRALSCSWGAVAFLDDKDRGPNPSSAVGALLGGWKACRRCCLAVTRGRANGGSASGKAAITRRRHSSPGVRSKRIAAARGTGSGLSKLPGRRG